MMHLVLLLLFTFTNSKPLSDELPHLNVWVVAHTHDDTGWLKTVDSYYLESVQYILDTVVDALLAQPHRKFIYVEMAFFSRWWKLQTEGRRADVRRLVKGGQLAFVNGGWCMNDEAVAHYDGIINQMTEGHEFILEEFGESASPRVAWSIDPFGSSRMSARLWAQTGFDAFVIDRIDYRIVKAFKSAKSLEFTWRGSPSLGHCENADIFTHVLDSFYTSPAEFNWDSNANAPPVVTPQSAPSPFTAANVEERADNLMAMARTRAAVYRTPNLLFPFGHDFAFQNAIQMFKNMDMLIEYINAHPARYNATIQYSTLDDYFMEVAKNKEQWPEWTDDFFPNAYPSIEGGAVDENDSYWTGFYSSRATTKAMARATDAVLRSAEVLHALARARNLTFNRTRAMHRLDAMRKAQSVFQHHDAITGTETHAVAADYMWRMGNGSAAARAVASEVLEVLVPSSRGTEAPGTVQEIVVTNSLARSRSEYVHISVPHADVVVEDGAGHRVASQIDLSAVNGDARNYTVWWLAHVPALGATEYYVKTSAQREVARESPVAAGTPVTLENEHIILHFGPEQQLVSWTDRATGKTTRVAHQFMSYRPFVNSSDPIAQTSGAYIFRPDGLATSLGAPEHVLINTGPLVSHVRQLYTVAHNGQTIVQTVRLFHGLPASVGSVAEVYTEVGPVDVSKGGMEIITRFDTEIRSGLEFVTDLNGLENEPRTRLPHGRPADMDQGVAIAGNYYPVCSREFVRDNNTQLTLLVDQSHGGSSVKEGSLELMLHRRLLLDDDRGVDEALNESTIACARTWLLVTPPPASSDMYRDMSFRLQYPLALYPREGAGEAGSAPGGVAPMRRGEAPRGYAPLVSDLPANVFVLTFKARSLHSPDYILRLLHPFESGESARWSVPVTVDLCAMFDALAVSNIRERSLTLNRAASGSAFTACGGEGYKVTLHPMEIRVFLLQLNPRSL